MEIIGGRGRAREWALPAVVFALGLAAASGCGSGGESATTEASSSASSGRSEPAGVTGGSGEQAAQAHTDQKTAKSSPTIGKTGGPAPPPPGHGSIGSDPVQKGSPSADADAEGRREGASRLGVSNSGRCPSGLSRSECEAIAEQVGNTPSHPASSVEECVKAIGKEQCERLLQNESATRNGGPSIDAKACLEHPTPRCEEALAPILEAEREAHQGR
jgi:hypothetical protein